MTNSVPAPVGPVHYSEPRAVMVREPENFSSRHSAVQSPLIVYTDTVNQAKELIKRWPEIIEAAAEKAEEILNSAAPDPAPAESETDA